MIGWNDATVGVARVTAGQLTHAARRTVVAATLVVTALVGAPAVARADEVRTFAVSVDGKPGGTYAIATATAADGTESVAVAAAIKVKTLVGTYHYELNSTEVWKGGRLVSVTARANDDGKKHAVAAVATERGLRATVGKETKLVPADAITSTGVRAPAGDKPREAVVFDVEDGTETAAKVEPLGPCRVALNGKTVEGTRFRVTGKDLAAEWWFDANGRVIRQEMTWDGHKVVLELTGVK
ncbi:Uncharacterized protein OS=Magnetospirillum sp. SO-1 GN=H261_18300 PE=4 SV=1 [Gemmata massiliana]|uniref:Uncharacterized protein n=1 Tax=Gemmata massiliana TaxID=1210884 RepID=A0A6P2CZY3_9BACT|nr:DUF6134 family protein [Gemmata massiliana]VTR94117.1 Uncharacterized protein OS=Magnetospirillum sp. SO-1 GN=H261_18300 PE=4 SV=1 [Gemmata massiliana]